MTWPGARDGTRHRPARRPARSPSRASAGAAERETEVRVLASLATLELCSVAASRSPTPRAAAATLRVTGRDAQGYTAPIELADLTLDYDHARARHRARPPTALQDRRRWRPAARRSTSGRPATIARAADHDRRQTEHVYDVRHADELARWNVNGTRRGHQRARRRRRRPLQARPTRPSATWASAGGVAARADSAPRPAAASACGCGQGDGAASGSTISLRRRRRQGHAASPGLRRPDGLDEVLRSRCRPGVEFPIPISAFQVHRDQRRPAERRRVHLRRARGRHPERRSRARRSTPLRRTALFSRRRHAPTARTTGRSPRCPTSSSRPPPGRWPRSASRRSSASARTTPDLVVLNGDITDRGCAGRPRPRPPDARGRRLRPGPGRRQRRGRRRPRTRSRACYVPGNHESYGTAQPDALDRRVRRSRTARSTTRARASSCSTATLRHVARLGLGAAADAAGGAATPRPTTPRSSRHGLRPPPGRRPGPGDASPARRPQRGRADREAADRLPREPARAWMVGSHAQIANVAPRRGRAVHGAPVVAASRRTARRTAAASRAGCAAASTAQRRSSGSRPTCARSRSQRHSTGPDALEVGESAHARRRARAALRRRHGTRVVPLRYPMSVRWSGSRRCRSAARVDDARRAGKVALLTRARASSPRVRAGEVTVTATTDSMRDGDDLAPSRWRQDDRRRSPVRGTAGRGRAVGGTVPATLSLTLGRRRRPSARSRRAWSASTRRRPPRPSSRPRATRR